MSNDQPTTGQTSPLGQVRRRLFAPIDAAWLVFFRIGFGLLMLWHAASYLAAGRVRRFWIEPQFHFKFAGFEWIEPWAGEGMIVHFWVLGLLALFIAAGFLYRLSAVLFFLGFTYVFLLEQARYQNHTYLICLLAFLAIFLPANRAASVDAWLRPSIRSQSVPAWTLWLARFQVGVPYFFGGIAKLNGDWLRGEPLREWLARETDFPLLGRHLGDEWSVYAFSYGGLILDLVALPLLLWRRTRLPAFFLLFLFHVCNARLFALGVFPWMMVVLTTVFLQPDWPRRIGRALWTRPSLRGSAIVAGAAMGSALALWFPREMQLAAALAGAVAGAIVGNAMGSRGREEAAGALTPARRVTSRRQRLVFLALSAWAMIQVLLPLRHFLIPGKVAWTAEGQRFSWHMKLNDTDGEVLFHVTDPHDGYRIVVDPREALEPWQTGRIDGRPHMIRQFARYLAAQAQRAGHLQTEVRVEARLSLNNRPPQLLIDPQVDMARAPAVNTLGHAEWIVPLQVGRSW